VQAVLQVKHELGAVPDRYLPVTQVLQSFAPTPTQLTQGETHGWQELSADTQ
jgi:hypothetical protein